MGRSSLVPKSRRKAYLAAFVVGTALSTLGSASAEPVPASRSVSDVSRYCIACWRNARLQPDAWSDCTQEVFVRLLERVPARNWDRVFDDETVERRELLRAIDAVKKRTQRAHRTASIAGDVADDRTPQQRDHDERNQTVRSIAAECLSPRQARIVDLSLDGWSVHEIAEHLQLSTARVSDEKYKAIQKLRSELAAN